MAVEPRGRIISVCRVANSLAMGRKSRPVGQGRSVSPKQLFGRPGRRSGPIEALLVLTASRFEFEVNLKGNLYKLWVRLCSGSYIPPAVLEVQIPKPGGEGSRRLGVPTVSDRVAQCAIASILEPLVEPHFRDSSSFGGESERSREPDVLLHPPQCQPSGAEARIASRELWAAGTGPGLLPVLLSRGFVRGGRGRGIPCACRGAGWLREVVARRPWMAGGIGTDDVSPKCARLGRWPGRREPRGYQGIHGRSVQRVTPKRRGEPKKRRVHPSGWRVKEVREGYWSACGTYRSTGVLWRGPASILGFPFAGGRAGVGGGWGCGWSGVGGGGGEAPPAPRGRRGVFGWAAAELTGQI